MTTDRSPISLAAIATLAGSVWSKGSGSEESTAQKAQLLEHLEPSIIKAAVGIEKHSPLFGHLASSQTVASPNLLNNVLVARRPPGFLTFTHSGSRMLSRLSLRAHERGEAYFFLSVGIVFKNRKNTELCQIGRICQVVGKVYLCHPELDSGSRRYCCYEMLNRVQHDNCPLLGLFNSLLFSSCRKEG